MPHDIAYNLPRMAHAGRIQIYGVNGRYRLTNGQGDIEHRSTDWPGGTYGNPERAQRDGLLVIATSAWRPSWMRWPWPVVRHTRVP